MSELSKKVSIIIPVYNGEKYIAEAIQSALDQDYQNKEIIVVNDGSLDKTEEICRRFFSKITYFYQENKGLGASRNRGVLLATGDYFAFLDCDDLWSPSKIKIQMQYADDRCMVFSLIKQFVCSSLSDHEKSKIVLTQEVMRGYLGSCLLIHRDRFRNVGNFLETKEVGEFIDWYARAKALNIPDYLVEEVLVYRRIHDNNMGRQKEKYSRQEYLKILKKNIERQRQSAGSIIA